LNEFTSTTTLADPLFVEVPEEEELEVASITTKIKWYKHFLSQSSFIDGNCPVLEVGNHNEARGWENAFMYKISSEEDGSNSSYYDNRYSFLGCAVPHTYTDGFVPQYQSIWRDEGKGSDEYKFLYGTYGFDDPEPANTANDNTMNYLLELQLNKDVRVKNQNSVNYSLAGHEYDSLGLDVIRTKIGHVLYGAGNTAPIDKLSWASQFERADPITFVTNSGELIANLSEDAGKAINRHIADTFNSYTFQNTGVGIGDPDHSSLAQLLITRLREAGTVGTERIAALQEPGRNLDNPNPWRPILCVGDRIIFNAKFDSSKHATLITRVEIEICDHDNERYDAGADATSSSLLELELTTGTNKHDYYTASNVFSINEQVHNDDYTRHVGAMVDGMDKTQVALDRLCFLLECKASDTPINSDMLGIKQKILAVKTKVSNVDYYMGKMEQEESLTPNKTNVKNVNDNKTKVLLEINCLKEAIKTVNCYSKKAVEKSQTRKDEKEEDIFGDGNDTTIQDPLPPDDDGIEDPLSGYNFWGNDVTDTNSWRNTDPDNEEAKQAKAAKDWGIAGEYAYSKYWKDTTYAAALAAVSVHEGAVISLNMLGGAASGASADSAADQNVTEQSVETLRQAMELANKAFEAACVAFDSARAKLQHCLMDLQDLKDILNDNKEFVETDPSSTVLLSLNHIMNQIFGAAAADAAALDPAHAAAVDDFVTKLTEIVTQFSEMMNEHVRIKGLEMGTFLKQVELRYNGAVHPLIVGMYPSASNFIMGMQTLISDKKTDAYILVNTRTTERNDAVTDERDAVDALDVASEQLANGYDAGLTSDKIKEFITIKTAATTDLQNARAALDKAKANLTTANNTHTEICKKDDSYNGSDFTFPLINDLYLQTDQPGAIIRLDDINTHQLRVLTPYCSMVTAQQATVSGLSREQTGDLFVHFSDGQGKTRTIAEIQVIASRVDAAYKVVSETVDLMVDDRFDFGPGPRITNTTRPDGSIVSVTRPTATSAGQHDTIEEFFQALYGGAQSDYITNGFAVSEGRLQLVNQAIAAFGDVMSGIALLDQLEYDLEELNISDQSDVAAALQLKTGTVDQLNLIRNREIDAGAIHDVWESMKRYMDSIAILLMIHNKLVPLVNTSDELDYISRGTDADFDAIQLIIGGSDSVDAFKRGLNALVGPLNTLEALDSVIRSAESLMLNTPHPASFLVVDDSTDSPISYLGPNGDFVPKIAENFQQAIIHNGDLIGLLSDLLFPVVTARDYHNTLSAAIADVHGVDNASQTQLVHLFTVAINSRFNPGSDPDGDIASLDNEVDENRVRVDTAEQNIVSDVRILMTAEAYETSHSEGKVNNYIQQVETNYVTIETRLDSIL
jgi:hypothetical protein